jgi:hypothetical protein
MKREAVSAAFNIDVKNANKGEFDGLMMPTVLRIFSNSLRKRLGQRAPKTGLALGANVAVEG